MSSQADPIGMQHLLQSLFCDIALALGVCLTLAEPSENVLPLIGQFLGKSFLELCTVTCYSAH